MSASRCIPGPSVLASASFCPASGRACPGETASPRRGGGGGAGPGGRGGTPLPGRLRAGGGRYGMIALGAGPPAPGNPGPQVGRGGLGQHPGRRGQPAAALPRYAGPTPGRRGRRPPGTLPHHQDQAGSPALPAHPGTIRLRLPALHRRAAGQGAGQPGLRVSEASNVLLLGPPGVGKTHLAVALAQEAPSRVATAAYFVRAYDLMEDLQQGPRIEHNLDRRMKHLSSSQGARGGRIRLLAL